MLVSAVADTSNDGFVRVMCLRSLEVLHPVSKKALLQALVSKVPDEDVGFGGNLMDPRICTHLPSVKEALQALVQQLR